MLGLASIKPYNDTPLFKLRHYRKLAICRLNSEKQGIELQFSVRPAQSVVDDLNANRWRWHRANKYWYAKDNSISRRVASKYAEIAIMLIMLFIPFISSHAQYRLQGEITYIDKEVCVHFETYKGKKNHGQKYCTSWITIREYLTGKIDTLNRFGSGKSMQADIFDKYDKLPQRQKDIVDSLQEDGIPELNSSGYLNYEWIYMKEITKIQPLYAIENGEIKVYNYLMKKGRGFDLKSVKSVK